MVRRGLHVVDHNCELIIDLQLEEIHNKLDLSLNICCIKNHLVVDRFPFPINFLQTYSQSDCAWEFLSRQDDGGHIDFWGEWRMVTVEFIDNFASENYHCLDKVLQFLYLYLVVWCNEINDDYLWEKHLWMCLLCLFDIIWYHRIVIVI